MSQILITESQLQRLTHFILQEQSENHPLLKLFYKKLSEGAKQFWDGTNYSCKKRKEKCLTEKDKSEMLKSFSRWLEKHPDIKEKPNKRMGTITISGKQEKEEIKNIMPIVEEPLVCKPILTYTIKAIADGQFQPFENNSTNLDKALITDLNAIAREGATLVDEGLKVKVVDFSIITSSSRYRNTQNYTGKSFGRLSLDRALAVQNYVKKKFGSLGIEVSDAKINAKGQNKDGSSGPNPPRPNKVVYDEGEKQHIYGNEAEEHRADFGKPHSSTGDYEKYKYVLVNIGLETEFPKDDVASLIQHAYKDADKEAVTVDVWKVRFYKKSKGGGNKKIWFDNWFKKQPGKSKMLTVKFSTKCPDW